MYRMRRLHRQVQRTSDHARTCFPAILLCLAFLVGGFFHSAPDMSAFAGGDLVSEQPMNGGHPQADYDLNAVMGVVHCHGAGSCVAVAPILATQITPPGCSVARRLEPEPLQTFPPAHGPFRPPRFSARV